MAVSLENPLAYCREKVSGDTASLHYATLFLNDEFKAFWLGCFTLNHELRQACLKQLEAGLTQVKLGWWQNALADAANNSNPHPVVTAISKPVIAKVPAEHWGKLINTLAKGCEVKRYNTMADWRNDIREETETWMKLVQARLMVTNMGTNLDANKVTDLNTAVDQSVGTDTDFSKLVNFWTDATRLCQVLRMAKYLDQGFQPLPVALLSQHGVTADQIKRREHNTCTLALFTEVCEQLVTSANAAWQTMPLQHRLFARPLRALFRMRIAELKVHKAAGYKLLSEQKIITPFKKFSTAWTTQVLRW